MAFRRAASNVQMALARRNRPWGVISVTPYRLAECRYDAFESLPPNSIVSRSGLARAAASASITPGAGLLFNDDILSKA